MTKKDIVLVKTLVENDTFEKLIQQVSDEEFNQKILQCFSTNEMIDALDERCELGEAHIVYMKRNKINLKDKFIYEFSKSPYESICLILGENKFATKEEIKDLIDKL